MIAGRVGRRVEAATGLEAFGNQVHTDLLTSLK
jgi:hypothetical protein